MAGYDSEIEKLRERIKRNQAALRQWGPQRLKEQDPEQERIAAAKQEREKQRRDEFLYASIEQDLRMIEILQRERDKNLRRRNKQAADQPEGTRAMGFTATVYRILIASPSDVNEERLAIPEVIHAWNDTHAMAMRVVLLPVMWERQAVPEMGARPQAIINRQLVPDCDMLIGAFWTRIGSHTGVAESGTVEEIEQLRAAGKPVLLYFSTQPVAPDSIDPDQYRHLKDYKAKARAEGLVDDYSNVAELRDKLGRHLLHMVREWNKPVSDGAAPASAVDSPQQSLAMIREQFAVVVRSYEAEWAAERDSQPVHILEAKHILRRLGDGLLEMRALLDGKVDKSIVALIDHEVMQTRKQQKFLTTIDQVEYYGPFWLAGDHIFQRLREIPERIRFSGSSEE